MAGATAADAQELLLAAGKRGVLVRGLGRAYGDAAQNSGGTLLELDRDAPVNLDRESGLVTVGAGVSLDRLMRELLPLGWFVPVTPGTRQVSVGGAVAADVHGKNHHVDGSWGSHVVSLTLLTADGCVREIEPDDSTGLFWATVGGMGLTGVVLSCTYRACAVTTSRMLVDTVRTADLDETLTCLIEADAKRLYSVAWLDVLAHGRALGRAVVTAGDHAPIDALDVHDQKSARTFAPRAFPAVPDFVPSKLLTPRTVAAFNSLWHRRAPVRRHDELQSIASFFHPLDAVVNWNVLYGSRGFVQYQFVVPDNAVDTLRVVIERMSAAHVPSFLTVLKRLGPSNRGLLSFPMQGWTMTLDIPAGTHDLAELLDELDEHVLASGGRENLAKDARVDPSAMATMYPRLEEWKRIRATVDPNGRFQSDLGRRLGLC